MGTRKKSGESPSSATTIEMPEHIETPPKRPWWKKKRYIFLAICASFVLIVVFVIIPKIRSFIANMPRGRRLLFATVFSAAGGAFREFSDYFMGPLRQQPGRTIFGRVFSSAREPLHPIAELLKRHEKIITDVLVMGGGLLAAGGFIWAFISSLSLSSVIGLGGATMVSTGLLMKGSDDTALFMFKMFSAIASGWECVYTFLAGREVRMPLQEAQAHLESIH